MKIIYEHDNIWEDDCIPVGHTINAYEYRSEDNGYITAVNLKTRERITDPKDWFYNTPEEARKALRQVQEEALAEFEAEEKAAQTRRLKLMKVME